MLSENSSGSSPHAWGTHTSFFFLLELDRFIPTCVGNSSWPGSVRNGNVWPVSSESDGTRRIIRMAAMVSPHNSDTVFLIDEFDRGLHPMMTRRLVGLFGSIPAPSCQLVATTHDTGLMTTALLRRDEIWLVEKEDGVSHLTSMDDLRLRASEDLERSYLDGRLPGAPRIGDVRP